MPAFVADPDLESAGHVSMTTLTTQQEQLLFQRFNFARCKVYRTLKGNKGKKLPLERDAEPGDVVQDRQCQPGPDRAGQHAAGAGDGQADQADRRRLLRD